MMCVGWWETGPEIFRGSVHYVYCVYVLWMSKRMYILNVRFLVFSWWQLVNLSFSPLHRWCSWSTIYVTFVLWCHPWIDTWWSAWQYYLCDCSSCFVFLLFIFSQGADGNIDNDETTGLMRRAPCTSILLFDISYAGFPIIIGFVMWHLA